MTGDRIIVETFAGPGGWSLAAARLGLNRLAGIELDPAACATRRAAGHKTIRADVSEFPVERLAGRVHANVGSPPCTSFSVAGDQAGNAVTDILSDLIADMFAGHDTRREHRNAMSVVLRAAGWPGTDVPDTKRDAKISVGVISAALVAEPARFIHASRPGWVVLEQVPSVLPLWQVYASELRRMGYSAWCGELNAADYGVPQTRRRAILIGSRDRQVSRPEPTHYDSRKGMQLWGTPWVSMAEALGWGATVRPVPTVTAGGVAQGGYEPFATGGRSALSREQDAGRWMLHRSRGASVNRRDHPGDEPAPTITSAGGKPGANLSWVAERPATTVQGDPRIGHPGHKNRDKGESQFAQDAVRITVAEAAALQSFPAGYPWQGTKTRQFEQIGNAVPPLLAAHVLAMAAGVSPERLAEATNTTATAERKAAA
jgi:DNA (cytosine-5)-methyltransferase 1